ncbi:hypothetical protein K1719_037848 [Acacia pycnantha]|nr:hypothetical protein K1719_037848 [Acacia pycnantha]
MTAPLLNFASDPFVSISKPLSLPLPFNSSYIELHGATLRASRDFIGVPVVVDLACMRDAMKELGSDSNKINPLVPVDLVIDHSVQVDVKRSENAVQANMKLEFQRNKEGFAFLKWGQMLSAIRNMLVVPLGTGIVHQVNLEYFGRVVFNNNGLLYPDSVPMCMVLLGVVGFKLSGKLRNGVTATDLVLTVTQMLRKHGVVGKFVEFFRDGMGELSLADRATIANMSLEYGATMGLPCRSCYSTIPQVNWKK